MINAINAEQQYINDRINGIETRSLIDILRDYNFTSLNEYYLAKKRMAAPKLWNDRTTLRDS